MEWKARSGQESQVKRQILQSDYKDGGIRMINVKNYVKACKAVWINKFLNTDYSVWKIIFKYLLGKKNCEIFLLSNFDTKELPITIPSFYREAIYHGKN